jgi:O-antigen/teichoic acid export membrane protein
MFVVIASYPEPILGIFGESFTQGRAVLYVLPLMYVAGALTGPCSAVLTMAGHQRVELLNGVLLVSLNIVLNLLLIPIYGALGAAIAVVIAGTVTNVVQVSLVYTFYGFHPFDRAHRWFVGIAAFVGGSAIFLGMRLGLLGRTLVCVTLLAFLGGLFYLQLDSDERALLRRALGRI